MAQYKLDTATLAILDSLPKSGLSEKEWRRQIFDLPITPRKRFHADDCTCDTGEYETVILCDACEEERKEQDLITDDDFIASLSSPTKGS